MIQVWQLGRMFCSLWRSFTKILFPVWKDGSAAVCVLYTDLVLCMFQVFIKDLVWNLFGEGNDVFKEGEWTKSIEMYTEALSIAEYADSEDICVPTGLLEKLYANRAAAYLNIVPVSHRWPSLFSFASVSVPSLWIPSPFDFYRFTCSFIVRVMFKIQQAAEENKVLFIWNHTNI